MEMINVTSSNIDSVGYEESSSTLYVQFKSGDLYKYYGVPENKFSLLLKSQSAGSYLNQEIKGHYRYDEVR